MIDDNIGLPDSFQVHKFKVMRPANKEFLLFPFGDVHKFAPMHSREHWQQFLTEAKRHPSALFLGMGDYLELYSSKENKAMRYADLHESSMAHLEEHYDNLIDEFYNDIKFMEGRVIGLLDGNHSIRFSDSTTSTQRLCRKLKCKYLGDTAFVRLNISRQKGHNGPSMTIFCSHGIGGSSRTISGDVALLVRMERVAEGVDVFLQGHTHQRWAHEFPRMMVQDTGPNGLRIQQRHGYFIRTGSFLRAYVPGQQSYAARRLYAPTTLGVIPLSILFSRNYSKQGETYNIELKAIV